MSEIRLLQQIKSCYLYYLASYIGGADVENTTYIIKNMETIKASLKELYVALSSNEVNMQSRQVKLKTKTCHWGDDVKAVMLFNSDKRFSITE